MSYADEFVQFYEGDLGRVAMDREAAYVEQFVEQDDRLLNVGAGVGEMERRFTDHCVVGLDASESMLSTAVDRTDAPLVLGDARSLPFPAETFDVVSFVATLEFVPEAETAVSEACRVLASDGTLVVELMNTQSAYVQANFEMEGSYFQKMVHRDSMELADLVTSHLDDAQIGYFLGIGDGEIYETDSPDEAAVLGVSGTPARR